MKGFDTTLRVKNATAIFYIVGIQEPLITLKPLKPFLLCRWLFGYLWSYQYVSRTALHRASRLVVAAIFDAPLVPPKQVTERL